MLSIPFDNIDISALEKSYKGGTSSYHPRMLLKSKARTLLTSQQGIAKRKQRCWDVEAILETLNKI